MRAGQVRYLYAQIARCIRLERRHDAHGRGESPTRGDTSPTRDVWVPSSGLSLPVRDVCAQLALRLPKRLTKRALDPASSGSARTALLRAHGQRRRLYCVCVQG